MIVMYQIKINDDLWQFIRFNVNQQLELSCWFTYKLMNRDWYFSVFIPIIIGKRKLGKRNLGNIHLQNKIPLNKYT